MLCRILLGVIFNCSWFSISGCWVDFGGLVFVVMLLRGLFALFVRFFLILLLAFSGFCYWVIVVSEVLCSWFVLSLRLKYFVGLLLWPFHNLCFWFGAEFVALNLSFVYYAYLGLFLCVILFGVVPFIIHCSFFIYRLLAGSQCCDMRDDIMDVVGFAMA